MTNEGRGNLSELLTLAMEQRLAQVHVSLPGEVVSYDYKTRKASVQPSIKRRYKDGLIESLPIITGVPVVWPGSKEGMLHLPLNKGDTVSLVFAERSIENWLNQGGQAEPGDGRKHDLTDAVAYPGLSPFNSSNLADNNDDLQLRFKSGLLRFQKDDKMAIGVGGEEMLSMFEELLTALENGRTPTLLGMQRMETAVPVFTDLKTRIGKIKGAL